MNGLARIIGAVELKSILGNINAQHVYSHVDLPSKVKVHQTKSSLEDPAVLAAWVGMVHYISTFARDTIPRLLFIAEMSVQFIQ